MTLDSNLEKRRAKSRADANLAIERVCQANFGKTRAEVVAGGAKFGGAHIDGFREGWAIIPFNRKPHYWKRQDLTHKFTALCGFQIDQTNYLPGGQRQFAPGDFMDECCKRCEMKRGGQS